MITVKDIENTIFAKFNQAILDVVGSDRKKELHVSDVISPCMRKVFYDKNVEADGSYESIRSLYFGTAIHGASKIAMDEKHELKLAYDYVNNESVPIDKLPMGDKAWDVIIGSIDDLIEVDGVPVICDKKTTGSISWYKTHNMHEAHSTQLNAYRVLLKKCKGLDVQYGSIIYISNQVSKESVDPPIVKVEKLKPVEETLLKLIKNGESIKHAMMNNELPERNISDYCVRVCSHYRRCFA